MFVLHIKRLFRNKKILILIGIYLFGLHWWFLYRKSEYDPYLQGGLDIMIQALPYIFLLVLYLSYEIFRKLNETETMELISNRRVCFKDQKYDFAILLALILSGTIIVWHSLKYHASVLGYNENTLYIYFFRIAIVFVLLPQAIAVLIGWCISAIKSRTISICLLLGIFYLFDTSFHQLLFGLNIYNEKMFHIGTLFTLFDTQLEGAITDMYYLMSAEKVHIFRGLFWVCLLNTILWGICKRRWQSIISGMLSLTFLIAFFQPSGASYALQVINGFDRWKGEQYYYTEQRQLENEKNYISKSNENFRVLSYDLNMSVNKDILESSAKIRVDQDSLDEYIFTLFHRYHIKSVVNQDGKILSYQQDGDYIRIESNGNSIQELHILYEGSSQYFYATTQGISLPANFAYYPIPGWKQVFINDQNNVCFTQNVMPEQVTYKVTVTCPKNLQIYTNLSCTKQKVKGLQKKAVYKGESDGITIVASPYLQSKKIKNVRVVYSVLDEDNCPDREEYLVMYEDFFKKNHFPKGTTFFAMPEENYSNVCFGKDQIIDQIYKADSDYELFQQQGNTYQPDSADDNAVEKAMKYLE